MCMPAIADVTAFPYCDACRRQGAKARLVIDSFMIDPPMSLHPAFSRSVAHLGPIFTQLACIQAPHFAWIECDLRTSEQHTKILLTDISQM